MGVVTFFHGWEIAWHCDEEDAVLCSAGLALPWAYRISFLSLGLFCETGLIPTLECLDYVKSSWVLLLEFHC
jgi:hypothetical protein